MTVYTALDGWNPRPSLRISWWRRAWHWLRGGEGRNPGGSWWM